MSVALMVLIGGALQFYGRTMNVRDTDVRQIQLASAVLQMIEDDLRATLHTEPVDTAGLEAMLAASSGQEPSSSEDLSAAGIDSEVSDGGNNMLTDMTILETPGLIGGQNQIQVDLSRLPRLEEYAVMFDDSAANLEDVPSDLKTVSYFVQAAGTIGGVLDAGSSIGAEGVSAVAGGLVRRTLDRAATLEAALSGGLTRLNQTGDLVAPEVIAIEFAYWDGVSWLPEWSSDQYGELPPAVRVRLTMEDPIAQATNDNPAAAATRVFQHVIRLPLSRPVDNSQEDDLTEAGL